MSRRSKRRRHRQTSPGAEPVGRDRIVRILPSPSTWVVCLTIVAFTVAAYANSLRAPFTFDDIQHIVENPHIQIETLSPSELWRAAFDSLGNRPLASLSFAANYYWGGLNVWGFHVVNVGIHAVNGLLVCLLAVQLSRRLRPLPVHSSATTETDTSVRTRSRLATAWFTGEPHHMFGFAVALWFVSHPVQTQAVTYIVQRMASLATMFYLAALLCYVAGRARDSWPARLGWWSGCFCLWILALASKEFAVTLPLAILLCEWFLFQDARWDWVGTGIKYAVPAAAAIVLVVVTFKGGKILYLLTEGYAEHRDFTLVERLLTQPRVVAHYATLAACPWPARLSLVYDFPTSHSLFSPVSTILYLLGIGVFVVGAFVQAHRYRLASFCILWFFLHLAVESTVIPLEMVYEHRLYLPIVGPLLLAGGLWFFLISDARLAMVGAVVIAVILATGTHIRNRDYANGEKLWSDNVIKHPREPRSHHNLGLMLAYAGEYHRALQSVCRAIELQPNFHRAYVTRAEIQIQLGELAKALDDLNHAMRIPPQQIRFAPDYGKALQLRGALLVDFGRFEEAVQELNRAIRGRPDLPRSHYHRGRALAALGRYGAAVDDFESALELGPSYVDAHNDLAWLLATCPDPQYQDGQQAVEHAHISNEHFEGKHAPALDTLAAACARAGDFSAAVQWQRRAIEFAPSEEVADLRSRLLLYEQRQAYTENRR